MSRSAAVPDELERYAKESEQKLAQCALTFHDLHLAYEAFRATCPDPINSLPFVELVVSRMRETDQFAHKVGQDFLRADLAKVIADPSLLPAYVQDRFGKGTTYDPFADVRADAVAAQAAGYVECQGPSTGSEGGYVVTGPDGQTYYLSAPNGAPGWVTTSTQEGVIQQTSTTTTGVRIIYAIAGSDPLGTAQSAEWYRQHMRSDGKGGVKILAPTESGYQPAQTPPIDPADPTKSPGGNTGDGVAGGLDTLAGSLSAAKDADNIDSGYYVVEYQQDAQGNRRAVATFYQVRGTAVFSSSEVPAKDLKDTKRSPVDTTNKSKDKSKDKSKASPKK
jgi:hypothetical protein